MAGKNRPPDEEASFWFTWTFAGAFVFVTVISIFILN